MTPKIKIIRAKIAAELAAPAVTRPTAPCREELVAEWNAHQKLHRTAIFKGVAGRFSNQPKLIAFLTEELRRGERTRAAIARDAKITHQTLQYFIRAGKVPPGLGKAETRPPSLALP